MSEVERSAEQDEAMTALRARADALERQLADAETRSATQLRQAELKAEALRAGILDVDGLRLLDPEAVLPTKDGATFDATEVIARLRREKPWLFGGTHSSSAAAPPAAASVRRRLATDMSVEEWRAARADLLRRR